MMPGKKDTISVKIDGERTLVQKRLLLLDLRGLFIKFNECYPDCTVGFSTFAKLRPKHCVLAGPHGTHSVCVCTIHENCKLMLEAINVQNMTKQFAMQINNYKDCLYQIMCKEPSSACYLDTCTCPGITDFSESLLQILDHAYIWNIQFSTWTGTDRSTLLTKTVPIHDYVEELCDKLKILKPHSFIAKQQSQYLEDRKKNLSKGEVLVLCDFSENYAYVVQNASQAFHFNNDQCTVFSVLYYYKTNSAIKHKSLIFLSDSLKHDTAAVYTIQSSLLSEIRNNLNNVKKIIYFTDGAKQHFKNRYQMINLMHHEEDFGLTAEWHFHATAHGKNACDGIGATFKREAARVSLLAKPTEAILTSKALFDWAQKHFAKTKILYYNKSDHERFKRKLNRRFQSAPAVPEIQKNHSFTVLPHKRHCS